MTPDLRIARSPTTGRSYPSVEAYEEPTDWRARQRRLLGAIASEERAIAREVGEEGASAFAEMARGSLLEQSERRYVLCVAIRR